jgi:hypothetical protein
MPSLPVKTGKITDLYPEEIKGVLIFPTAVELHKYSYFYKHESPLFFE